MGSFRNYQIDKIISLYQSFDSYKERPGVASALKLAGAFVSSFVAPLHNFSAEELKGIHEYATLTKKSP
jgi:hypothetical protein